MPLSFDVRIEDAAMHCIIGSDVWLKDATLCCSLMAPGRVVSGGELTRSVGGYLEVAIGDVGPDAPAEVVLAYADADLRPANRAWWPLGAYLRRADGSTIGLPPLPAGVVPGAPRPAEECEGLRLVPPPREWAPAGGVVRASGFASDAAPLRSVDALAGRTGLGPFLAPDGVTVSLRDAPEMEKEGYALTIAEDGVTLSASDAAGAFYGGVTLLTLMRTYEGAIPCGRIADAPRFGWRGQHLDCARHFYETDTLLRLLDLMALLKMNRFHWHFADDEAFRLETETAPEIWRKTAFRGEGEAVPGVFGGGIRAGGTYGPKDVAAVLDRAAELHMGVMPEIEVPGHSLAPTVVLPGLRDPDETGDEVSVQGYAANAINPAMSGAWKLLKPLTTEIGAMFPLGVLHLGCDELAPGTWDGSPAADRLKAEHGLASRDDLQGWMMERLAGHVAAQGVRPAAWEEAAKGAGGGIGHGALLFSWTGQGTGVAAARAGYDVVMTPGQHVYLDMAHTDHPDDWGANWAAVIPLEAVVDWSPVPEGAEDVADRIVGVQGTFWSEFTTRDAEMEPMLAPRILGVACKAWEVDGATDGARLRAFAAVYGPAVFDPMGWARHTGA